jgi:hypothetical protein
MVQTKNKSELGCGVVTNVFGYVRNILGSLRALPCQTMFMSRNRALDSGKKIVMRSSTDEIDTIDTLQRGVLYLGIYFSSTEDGVIVEVKIE